MITRINLIEKKRFEVTYGTIALALGLALGLCLLLYGVLWLGGLRSQKLIANLQTDIERLKKEREQIISQQTAFQGEGPALKIEVLLEKSPTWSTILQAITQALPPRIWLGSINSAAKEGESAGKEIILNGKAKTSQAVTAFLSNLNADFHFNKVVLTTSDKDEAQEFNFTITCAIGSKPWPHHLLRPQERAQDVVAPGP